MHVVPRPRAQAAIFPELLPRLATIVRTEDCPLVRLDDRPETVALRRGDREADFAEDAFRQSGVVRDFLPGIAAVRAAEDAAARSATVQFVRPAVRLPEGGIQDTRVIRIDREIDCAGALVAEEDMLPISAAVLR